MATAIYGLGMLALDRDRTGDAGRLLDDALAETRATGIGTSFSEYEPGLNGISAAARDAEGEPVAYLSLTGPDYRLPASRTAAVTPLREPDAYPAMPEDGYGW